MEHRGPQSNNRSAQTIGGKKFRRCVRYILNFSAGKMRKLFRSVERIGYSYASGNGRLTSRV